MVSWATQALIVPRILLPLFLRIWSRPHSASRKKIAGFPDLPCRLQEAADLSSLKPRLDELGVPLYAVVKEQVKNEVKDFQPYFKGEIFLDEEVHVL